MKRIRAIVTVAGLLAVATACALAAEVAPGVTHTVYSAPGPTTVYVVAVDRLHSEYKLAVGFAEKKRNFTVRQRTTTIAGLYDNPAGNHDVIAATNGSYFGVPPDIVGAPIASMGEILDPPSQYDTFMMGPQRLGRIEADIGGATGTLTFTNGTPVTLHQYNQPVAIHKITAFTPQYDTSTRSSTAAVEVILSNVSYPMRSGKEVAGTVTAIRTGAASLNNAIPAGGMVLNAYGAFEAPVLANTQVGDRLRMRFATTSEGMNNADTAITGIGWILNNGLPQNGTNGQPNNWAVRSPGTPYSRDPMTVLASNSTHWFMVVCDGRGMGGSVGMTFAEMAAFLTGTLGATEAINLDGGGSSTMVVDGLIKNIPSDGSERSVANAVLLVKQTPPASFPFVDPFGPAGRKTGWDDKLGYCGTVPFVPLSPAGDGHVLRVINTSGANTVRRGDFADADYSVQADIYCAYRPGDAADGFERCGIFARDSGTGAFGLATYGGGNCYAMSYDTDTGRIRAGKYVNGALTDLLAANPPLRTVSGWYRFRIDCAGTNITYRLDDQIVASVADSSFARGYFGLAHHEFFTTDTNVQGTHADNFVAFAGSIQQPADMDDDGDVDQADFGLFQACMTAPDVSQNASACEPARLDPDSDVDQDDFQLFFGCMTGPNGRGNPSCAG